VLAVSGAQVSPLFIELDEEKPDPPHPLVLSLTTERKRRGLSQAKVGRTCGWSRQRQSKLEKSPNPSIQSLETFAKALGLSLAFVIDTPR